jgi:hypothetical protein
MKSQLISILGLSFCLAACSVKPLLVIDQNRTLKTRHDALDFAEPIIHAYFDRGEIRRQRPMNCELVDSLWVISGSRECASCADGRFEIVLRSTPAQLVKISALRSKAKALEQ